MRTGWRRTADGGWKMQMTKCWWKKGGWKNGDMENSGWQNADNEMLVANEPSYLKEIRQAQLFILSHKTDQNTVHRQGKKPAKPWSNNRLDFHFIIRLRSSFTTSNEFRFLLPNIFPPLKTVIVKLNATPLHAIGRNRLYSHDVIRRVICLSRGTLRWYFRIQCDVIFIVVKNPTVPLKHSWYISVYLWLMTALPVTSDAIWASLAITRILSWGIEPG